MNKHWLIDGRQVTRLLRSPVRADCAAPYVGCNQAPLEGSIGRTLFTNANPLRQFWPNNNRFVATIDASLRQLVLLRAMLPAAQWGPLFQTNSNDAIIQFQARAAFAYCLLGASLQCVASNCCSTLTIWSGICTASRETHCHKVNSKL